MEVAKLEMNACSCLYFISQSPYWYVFHVTVLAVEVFLSHTPNLANRPDELLNGWIAVSFAVLVQKTG